DLVTDEDGEIRIGFPKEFIGKTLCYKETKAPDGIKYDKEEKELKILEENKWSNNFITNEFDKESNGGIKIEVEKRDDNKQPLEGAEFTLYNKKGDVLSTKTSTKIEEDGSYHAIAIFNDSDFEGGFKVGEEYYIKETKAPEGYILDDSVAKIVVDKESFEQDQNGIGTKRLLFMAINSKYKGLLELKKVDEDGGKPLKGAKFELFRKKNNITKEEQNDENLNKESTPITDPKNWQHYGNYRYKTNINGEIVVENLAIGEYYYIEREAPVGYEGTEKASGKFEITKNNNNKDHIDKIEIKVKNKKLENATGKFKLVKKDEEGKNLLEGAEFKLFKLENDIIDGVEYRSYGDNPYTTDGNGEINIENLPIGKYYIKETKAPDGYVLPTLTANRKYYFEIGFNPDKQKVEIEVNNVKKGDKPSKIIIKKVDKDTKIPLIGAKFKLYYGTRDDNNEIVYKPYKQNGKEKIFITNEKGEINIEKIPNGDYMVEEIEAPEGYKLPEKENDRKYYFKVGEGKDIIISIENKKESGGGGGGTVVPKPDPDPDKPVNPDKPDKPDKPVDPDKPDKPDKPVDPNKPDKPDKPVDPNKPDKPDKPVDPNKPDKPDKPEDPNKPDKPDKPEDPNKPDKPDKPVDPNKPDNPNDSGNPSKPNKPSIISKIPKTGDSAQLLATGAVFV
ncbi:MSCRAMM family protein, partial [Peptacetobacter sp.]|uniref:MSCRAMM family protein n=1 Tax=Peptacetobacter sp. TaxID=2991975 RepID=UPI0026038104